MLFDFALMIGCSQSAPPRPTAKQSQEIEFTTTASGLKYRILRDSNASKPTPTDWVSAHYKGWLPDPTDGSKGKVFGNSYERGEPIQFPLTKDPETGMGVIDAWEEGVQLVGVGGIIELEVPPNLTNGPVEVGGGDIPPGVTLRFIIEVLEIIENPRLSQ